MVDWKSIDKLLDFVSVSDVSPITIQVDSFGDMIDAANYILTKMKANKKSALFNIVNKTIKSGRQEIVLEVKGGEML